MKLRYRDDAEIHAFHVNDAHTDGDSFYYFITENVIHLGDNFFNGRYPYVDISSGGDIDGMITNLYMAASMIDDQTVIIPVMAWLLIKKSWSTTPIYSIYLENLSLSYEMKVRVLKKSLI
jgi:hypothetical protein